MKRFIIDFNWQDGTPDWRGVTAESVEEAIRIFRMMHSFRGSYEKVIITAVTER